jgi:hypothetical protein
LRPPHSAGTLNFVPHFSQENAIRAGEPGAFATGGAGTTNGSWQPEQAVDRPAYSGLSVNCLPHFGHEKAIIAAS